MIIIGAGACVLVGLLMFVLIANDRLSKVGGMLFFAGILSLLLVGGRVLEMRATAPPSTNILHR